MIKAVSVLSLILSLTACATNVIINKTVIKSDEIPKVFDNYVIVFVSDLHINDLLPKRYFVKAGNFINASKPDLILMGGDYVDENTSDLEKAFDTIKKIASVKTIAALGNHDDRPPYELVKNKLEISGVMVLRNNNTEIKKEGEKITIAGLADYYTDKIDIASALAGVKGEDFCILLSHSPEPYSAVRNDPRVDLMLAGHTHGGQITFFGLWAPVLPMKDKTYWHGTYSSDINKLIITNGIGVSEIPLRVFAPPEINRITLERGK